MIPIHESLFSQDVLQINVMWKRDGAVSLVYFKLTKLLSENGYIVVLFSILLHSGG